VVVSPLFIRKDGGASFLETLPLLPLSLSFHDAHGRQILQLQLQLQLQPPLLSCACGHSPGPLMTCASRTDHFIDHHKKLAKIKTIIPNKKRSSIIQQG
jgi:hypothetical protein